MAAMATRSPLRLSIQSVDLPTLGYRQSSVFLRPRFPKPLLTSKGTTAACPCVPKGINAPPSLRAGTGRSPILVTLLLFIVLLFPCIWRRISLRARTKRSPNLVTLLLLLFFTIRRCIQILLFPQKQTLAISEFVGPDYNFMYPAVKAYLTTKIGHTPMITNLIKLEGQKDFTLTMAENQEIEDMFEGARYTWRIVRVEKREKEEDPIMDARKVLESDHPSIEAVKRFSPKATRTFYVTFYCAEQEKTLKSYIPHINAFLPAKDAGAIVRVTNLSKNTREPDLQDLFSNLGPVSCVCITYDQKTGMSRGLGFVKFVYKGDAEKAIAKLNGYDYDDLILRVEWDAPRIDENSVRVTNLSEDTREPALQDLFSTFGSVSRVFIAYDHKTGMSRGFGFVTFVHKGDAKKAIAKLNGYGYDNLILRVEWARAVRQSSLAKVEWAA